MATEWGGVDKLFQYVGDFTYAAQSIRRLMAINETLPAERRIRAIVVIGGDLFGRNGKEEYRAARDAARSAGILVVETTITGGDGKPLQGSAAEGLFFAGLGRDPLEDPEVFESYGWWEDLDRAGYAAAAYFAEGQLYLPVNSRTLASPVGKDAFLFARQGTAWNMGTGAEIAGAYALAVQVDPSLTPERFLELAVQTGRTQTATYQGKEYALGPILDMAALIAALQ